MTTLTKFLYQIWTRRWIALAVTVVVAGIATWTSMQAQPTYVGKSVLIVASPGRAPDQDAVMVAGYAQLFNDPATIEQLRAEKQIPGDVTFEARTAADSPILTIEATAGNADLAASAAQSMAEAFSQDVNTARQQGNADGIADLSGQLAALRTPPVTTAGEQAPAAGPDSQTAATLLDRIITMKYDSTNQLHPLEPRGGVTEQAPAVARNIGLGTLGGLILGCLTAIVMASASSRVKTASDVREKTGLEPIAHIPSGGTSELDDIRGNEVRSLVNLVSLELLAKSTVVTLAGTTAGQSTWAMAREMAELWGSQGYRTVLVEAADNGLANDQEDGFFACLRDRSLVHGLLRAGDVDAPRILTAGRVDHDEFTHITRERVAEVFDELRADADFIVVAAPPATAAETRIIATSGDLTILVVDAKSATAPEVKSAAEAMQKVHAVVLGAVLVDGDAVPTAAAVRAPATKASMTEPAAAPTTEPASTPVLVGD